MDSTNFVIVMFVNEDDAPGIVASNWLIDGKTCYYPNVRSEEMKNKLLRKMAEPVEDTWPKYQIKILKGYETYGEARLHLKKAEETSNLDSDEETRKRKRKKRNVYSPEDSNLSDDYNPISWKTKARQNFTKKRNEFSNYPNPPKPVAKQNKLAEEVQENIVEVSDNVAMDVISAVNYPVITNPSCPNQDKDLSEFSPDIQLSSNQSKKTQPCPSEAVNYAYFEEDIVKVSNNVAMDVDSAVNFPVITILSSSNQDNKRQSELSQDVQFSSKQATKTQLCHNEAVNCPSGCITSKQFSIQQTHVIQVVTDLANQLADLHRKVDLLLGRSGETFITHTHDNSATLELLASLPVKDDASFCHLNDQLKISQNKQAIMTFLVGIGGRNIRSFTTNMLRRILLDNVAELYSLTGKQMKNSSKQSFLNTETCKLIFQICKNVYDNVTEENIREIISDWLNQAKVRITRRADRLKKI